MSEGVPVDIMSWVLTWLAKNYGNKPTHVDTFEEVRKRLEEIINIYKSAQSGDAFVPSESDKERMRSMFQSMEINDTQTTMWATYRKVDEKTLEIRVTNFILPSEQLKESIKRAKIICGAIGIKFIE